MACEASGASSRAVRRVYFFMGVPVVVRVYFSGILMIRCWLRLKTCGRAIHTDFLKGGKGLSASLE